MINRQQVMEYLMGTEVVDSLIETLCRQAPKFHQIYKQYRAAIEQLRGAPERGESTDQLVAAVNQQCAACLLFSGSLGLKMNYEHFMNPTLPNCTWPQVDYDDYLPTDIACSMPAYEEASRFIESFGEKLPQDQTEIWKAVTEYTSALEVYGTKLAHYCGYLIGNDLLIHCVPGYRPDCVLNLRYRHMLEEYFGCALCL